MVITSIHQPSTTTFELFDKVILLSRGRTCYFGTVKGVKPYFDSIGFEMPAQMNPAEYVLDLTNIDFTRGADHQAADERLKRIQSSWAASEENRAVAHEVRSLQYGSEKREPIFDEELPRSSKLLVPLTLLHRSFIKSYRDVVVYGIRIAMYTGEW